MLLIFLMIIDAILFESRAGAAPMLGHRLPICEVSNGGLEDDRPWVAEFGAMPTIIFYVDPDERATNDHVAQAIKNSNLRPDAIRSYAIINYAASWLPNLFIQNAIEQKQKEFVHTTYVKDLTKRIVSCWSVADDASVVMLVAKDGVLKFYHAGAVPPAKLEEFMSLLKSDI